MRKRGSRQSVIGPTFYTVVSQPDRLYGTAYLSFDGGVLDSQVVASARHFSAAFEHGARSLEHRVLQ